MFVSPLLRGKSLKKCRFEGAPNYKPARGAATCRGPVLHLQFHAINFMLLLHETMKMLGFTFTMRIINYTRFVR